MEINENEVLDELKNSNSKLKSKKLNKLIEHSKKVREIALDIFDLLEIDSQYRNVVILGALLHDIKKYDENGNVDKKHNKTGEKFLKLNYFNVGENEIILDIVRYHRGSVEKYEDKDEINIKLIEIVRAADKIAKLYKNKEVTREDIEYYISRLNDLDVKGKAIEVLTNRCEELGIQ